MTHHSKSHPVGIPFHSCHSSFLLHDSLLKTHQWTSWTSLNIPLSDHSLLQWLSWLFWTFWKIYNHRSATTLSSVIKRCKLKTTISEHSAFLGHSLVYEPSYRKDFTLYLNNSNSCWKTNKNTWSIKLCFQRENSYNCCQGNKMILAGKLHYYW